MKNCREVVINKICLDTNNITIFFDTSEKVESWIENSNKHNPDILYVDVDNNKKNIIINKERLHYFIGCFPGQKFKLSLCTTIKRLNYTVSENVQNIFLKNILIFIDREYILFIETTLNQNKKTFLEKQFDINHKNKFAYDNVEKLPIETLNIGSCFSRSIFRSDEYFNPEYKKYFDIKKTLFHNSFISLFSHKVNYDYSKIEDLNTGDAALFIDIEFDKDIPKIIKDSTIKLVIIDNYSDATSPVVKYNENSYLTYNKYFSESIFKRFFHSREIIYPGTNEHLRLYRNSIKSFKKILTNYGIKDVVLIGGRLSKYKIDPKTNQTYLWEEAMDWILEVNENWDKIDEIFLEEISNAVYIDKKETIWKSDMYSPIYGGASPSHYQSSYYKELFQEITSFIKSSGVMSSEFK